MQTHVPCLCWSEWNGVICNWKSYLIPVQKFHIFVLKRMNIFFVWAWWLMATWNCMWIHLETINVVYFGMTILTVWSLACLLSSLDTVTRTFQWDGCLHLVWLQYTTDHTRYFWQWRHLCVAQLAVPFCCMLELFGLILDLGRLGLPPTLFFQ